MLIDEKDLIEQKQDWVDFMFVSL